MNKTFAFRQRAGHLNWKLISSIDIFRIVDELRIDELQSVLDPIAFCEFSVSDVKRNTVDATTKLVHLMQLMIEYLLYCQEAQLLLLKDMDGQNRALRKDIKLCTRDNMSFREDIKIYKRQLALLKQALNQGGDGGDQITYRMINPPVSPEQLKPILEPICAMIESVHRHERETREYMRAALEQRPPQTATPSRDEDMSSLQQMQNAIVIARNEAKAEAKLRELELRAREKELEAREKELEAREKEQQRREGELAEALRRPPTAVVTTDSGNIKKWNVHFVAMNFLHTTLKSSFYKNINKYWLRWRTACWHHRVESLSTRCEYAQEELRAASIRETRLKAQLASERQHSILEMAKKNVQSRQKPVQNEVAVMTSVDLSTEPEPAPQHHYRSLTWGELAARNQYLASITSADDMMRRFERRVEFADRDIDFPKIDEIFKTLADEVVTRANAKAEQAM